MISSLRFTRQNHVSFPFRPMRATCSARLIFLDLVNLILYGDDYKSWSSLSSNFVLPSVTSSVFEPSIFLYICSQHPQHTFFLYCATPSFMPTSNNGQNLLCTFRSLCFQSVNVKALDSEAQGSGITLRHHSACNFSVNEVRQCHPHIYLTLPHLPRIY
jgi:hypothetical protein